jgi:8-oxo-dGTP pyrophosphatase MutT (NUDIX family)
MDSDRRPLTDLLNGYRPHGAVESGDLERLRALIADEADPWLRTLPLHVTASAVIVHPASRRVLLRWHQRQRAWLQVGGHADPGETEPLAVALREAEEETGLTDLVPWPDAELRQVAIVPVAPRHDEPAHHHADVRFTLATEHPEAIRPESPDAPLKWLTVQEAAQVTSQPNLREALSRVTRMLA